MLTTSTCQGKMNASPHWDTGSRNLVCYGEKSPHLIAAFLCPSFNAVIGRVASLWRAALGQRSALAGSITQFSTPFAARRPIASKLSAAVYSSVMESPL